MLSFVYMKRPEGSPKIGLEIVSTKKTKELFTVTALPIERYSNDSLGDGRVESIPQTALEENHIRTTYSIAGPSAPESLVPEKDESEASFRQEVWDTLCKIGAWAKQAGSVALGLLSSIKKINIKDIFWTKPRAWVKEKRNAVVSVYEAISSSTPVRVTGATAGFVGSVIWSPFSFIGRVSEGINDPTKTYSSTEYVAGLAVLAPVGFGIGYLAFQVASLFI